VLDAASNRRQTTILGTTQAYALDASMQTRDLAANQYTFVGNTARSHDLMGNLVGQSDTGRQAFYDADNRLVQWTEGSKDIRYRYDVDGRRTVKEDVGTASFPRTVYFWDGWQTVEEFTNTGSWAVNKQYVWGEGIDECLKANLPDAADINGNSNTTEKVDLYYHHNSIGSVVAVTNAAGAVKESYRYSAFGTPTVYNAAGTQVAATAVKQPFMFTGARYDFEEGSGLYQMRMRYYDPVVGRFVSRDPLGLWGDPSQNGNGQGYCGHNPVNLVDRLGLDDQANPGADAADDAALGALIKKWEADEAAGKHEKFDPNAKGPDWLDPRVEQQSTTTCHVDTSGIDWGTLLIETAIEGGKITAAMVVVGLAMSNPYTGAAMLVLLMSQIESCKDPLFDLKFIAALIAYFTGRTGPGMTRVRGAGAAGEGAAAPRDPIWRAPRRDPLPPSTNPAARPAQTPGEHVVGGDYLPGSPMESWTGNKAIAEEFAKRRGMGVLEKDLSKIPPGRIAADLRTAEGRAAAAAKETSADPQAVPALLHNQDAEVILPKGLP